MHQHLQQQLDRIATRHRKLHSVRAPIAAQMPSTNPMSSTTNNMRESLSACQLDLAPAVDVTMADAGEMQNTFPVNEHSTVPSTEVSLLELWLQH